MRLDVSLRYARRSGECVPRSLLPVARFAETHGVKYVHLSAGAPMSRDGEHNRSSDRLKREEASRNDADNQKGKTQIFCTI